jgi:hypothetical protein
VNGGARLGRLSAGLMRNKATRAPYAYGAFMKWLLALVALLIAFSAVLTWFCVTFVSLD